MKYPSPETFETSFAELCLLVFDHEPERELVRFKGNPWSVAEVLKRADDVATRLENVGVVRSDPVAVMLDNHPDHVATIIALGLLGAIWVPLDRRFQSAQVKRVLDQVEVKVVLVEDQYSSVVRASGFSNPLLSVSSIRHSGTGFRTSERKNRSNRISPDDTRALLFTSGTTGQAKGVVVTERMFVASALFCGYASNADADCVFYLWEPLNHIGGAQIVPMALLSGARIVIAEKFSTTRFWTEVIESSANRLHYLGGILELLLTQEPGKSDRQHQVTLGFGAGASGAVHRQFEERFGIPLREVYGMTEASSFTMINFDGPAGSIGRPLGYFNVELRNTAGAVVKNGQQGEITLTSPDIPLITPHYYKNTDATEQAFKDGYFRTGDLAYKDPQGYFYFGGRIKELIRSKGENISPAEIESVFQQHPAVLEVAVRGVDSDLGEEAIVAFVRLKNVEPDNRESVIVSIKNLLASDLAGFQIPRYIIEVERFPKTPSERIEKHKLDVSPTSLTRAW